MRRLLVVHVHEFNDLCVVLAAVVARMCLWACVAVAGAVPDYFVVVEVWCVCAFE